MCKKICLIVRMGRLSLNKVNVLWKSCKYMLLCNYRRPNDFLTLRVCGGLYNIEDVVEWVGSLNQRSRFKPKE